MLLQLLSGVAHSVQGQAKAAKELRKIPWRAFGKRVLLKIPDKAFEKVRLKIPLELAFRKEVLQQIQRKAF